MATKQTNRRSTGRKTTRKKSNSANKSMFLGIGLIAVLIGLIAFSVMGLKNSNGDKEPEQTITYIPSTKKEEQKEVAKNVAVPSKEDKANAERERKAREKEKELAKREQALKEKEKEQEEKKQLALKEKEERERKAKEQSKEVINNEDVTDLLRLVLYDHEISRSSVTERKGKTSNGKNITYFDIICDENMQAGVSTAISSILRNKGYKVNASKREIAAVSKQDEYRVVLKAPVKETVTKKEEIVETAKKEKPKKQVQPEKEKPKEVAKTYPPLPPYSKTQVKFAILLDDGGHNLELAKEFAAIKYPLAVAVLPHLEYTKQTAQIAKKAGKNVFLHFPMAPKSYPNTDPGKGAIIPSMPSILINGVVKENFESLGVKADGFNNHMGSAITEDAVKMAHILEASKQYTNRFVDSRTTAQTVALKECQKISGYKCGENRIFIDNDNNEEAILTKIYEAAEKAKKEGSLIAIGHIRQNTLQALKIALPELERRNYKLVSITELTK